MRRGEQLPRIAPEAPLAEGLLEMTRKGLGLTAVVDAQERVLGVFTDGDLRRVLDRRIDVHAATMREVMTRGGRSRSSRASWPPRPRSSWSPPHHRPAGASMPSGI